MHVPVLYHDFQTQIVGCACRQSSTVDVFAYVRVFMFTPRLPFGSRTTRHRRAAFHARHFLPMAGTCTTIEWTAGSVLCYQSSMNFLIFPARLRPLQDLSREVMPWARRVRMFDNNFKRALRRLVSQASLLVHDILCYYAPGNCAGSKPEPSKSPGQRNSSEDPQR